MVSIWFQKTLYNFSLLWYIWRLLEMKEKAPKPPLWLLVSSDASSTAIKVVICPAKCSKIIQNHEGLMVAQTECWAIVQRHFVMIFKKGVFQLLSAYHLGTVLWCHENLTGEIMLMHSMNAKSSNSLSGAMWPQVNKGLVICFPCLILQSSRESLLQSTWHEAQCCHATVWFVYH